MAASAPVVNPHNVGIVHIMALPVMEFQLRGLQNVVQKYKVSMYRTRAIITRGLYIFYPLFEAHLCTVTFGLMYGQYSRAGSNQERVIMARLRYVGENNVQVWIFFVFSQTISVCTCRLLGTPEQVSCALIKLLISINLLQC